ncbi:MAG: hypothetical protein KZQ66_17845, partial [Candidatus Thiodiazotropha sp. (ex Lucinoma aequizonata)]|nr:hypothetical protein [Candidatus Thiodiazotropha sp. (ex Lucinoma aequizonata)]
MPARGPTPTGGYLPRASLFHGGQRVYLLSELITARQKTHFFREPVLLRLVISGLIINTGAIFSCRRI